MAFGIDDTFEYTELALDSWDATNAGGGSLQGSTADSSLIKYSWPQFYYTSKKPNVVGLKVLQAEIPNVFDTIGTLNNTFVYTILGTPYLITVDTGYPTGPALATEIQTLLDAITPGFLVTWDDVKLAFTFTCPVADAWSLTFPSRDSLYSTLGFVPGMSYSASGIGSTITSAIIANISGPYYLYVSSTRLGMLVNFNTADGAKIAGIGPQICRIPINVQKGAVIFYTDSGNY